MISISLCNVRKTENKTKNVPEKKPLDLHQDEEMQQEKEKQHGANGSSGRK